MRPTRPRRAWALGALSGLALMAAACSSPSNGQAQGHDDHGAGSRSTTTTSSPLITVPKGSKPTLPPAQQSSQQLVDIAFVSPTTGYGLFSGRQGSTCTAQVGSTSDSGAHFGALSTVSSTNCLNGLSAGAIAADDHNDVFAYGPGLSVSHDGGKTWSAQNQSGTVTSVEALGSSIWLIANSCTATSPGPRQCRISLSESTDGGSSWSSRAVPSDLVTDGGSDAAVLVRLSSQSAYLGAIPPIGSAPSTPAPLWFTTNAGATWSNRKIPCQDDPFALALSAAPDGTLFAVCAAQPSAGNQVKTSLLSHDGGATWTTTFFCPTDPGATSPPTCALSPFFEGYLGSIDAVSATTAFLVGERSALTVTRDGGATWTPVQPPIGSTADGSWRVIFFSVTDGIVLANNDTPPTGPTLWRTTDGGATWRSFQPSA